jgi:uncharacterized protein
LADTIIDAGYVAVIDAASLKRWQRDLLRKVADEHRVPFWIVSCEADLSMLRQRITEREQQGRDASEASQTVLEHQLAQAEPLGEDERTHLIDIDTTRTWSCL